jgi:metal transporter CNNM
LLGKEFPELFDKSELKELIADHDGGTIDSDEKRIMMGAMKFSEKTAQDVITPATILFHLDEDVIITEATLRRIKHEHYSRIPVHSGTRDRIVGILYAKDLIGLNVTDLKENGQTKTIGDMCKRDGLLCIRETMHLDSLMNYFLKNKTHMAFVYNEFNILQGIVTLEDIMEEVLDIEILDESDTVADLQKLAASRNNQINLQD